MEIPETIAAHIHYGVPTSTALTAMTGGIRSRRLALAISEHFGSNAEGLRSRLAELGLSGWRAVLAAYPSELRDLLQYVRRHPQLVCDVLDGLTATVKVSGTGTGLSGEAHVVEDQAEPMPRPLVVLVEDQPQGQIPPDAYHDLRQLLEVGLRLTFRYDHTSGELTIGLAEQS